MKLKSLLTIILLFAATAFKLLAQTVTITGNHDFCSSDTILLVGSPTGGTWHSDNYVAIIPYDTSGLMYFPGPGTANITYTYGGVSVTVLVSVNPTPTPNMGFSTRCTNETAVYTNSDINNGTWSSSNTSVATITSVPRAPFIDGYMTPVGPGVTVLTYTTPAGCFASQSVTVNAAPAPISGASSICQGASTTLSDPTPGGNWYSANVTVATVGSTTGIVTGLAGGTGSGYTDIISYTMPNGCSEIFPILIRSLTPYGIISGPGTVCVGSIISLTNSVPGGTWTSSNTAIATIHPIYGGITGIAAGTVTISYTKTTVCGTGVATVIVTVIGTPDAGTILGSGVACVGSGSALSNYTGGGTWSSSNTSVATISAAGHFSGISAGTATITYTVTNSCGSAFTTTTVTINPLPVPGYISGSAYVPAGFLTPFTATPSGGAWASGNTAIATIDASGMVTGVAVGVVTISFTRTNSCGTVTSTASLEVTDCSGSGSGEGGRPAYVEELACIPNPNTGTFILKGSLGNSKATKAAIEIIDIAGRMVYADVVAVQNGSVNTFISLDNNVANGIYTIRVKHDGKATLLRISLNR